MACGTGMKETPDDLRDLLIELTAEIETIESALEDLRIKLAMKSAPYII